MTASASCPGSRSTVATGVGRNCEVGSLKNDETRSVKGLRSAPRETRTPTEDSLHKALNLAGRSVRSVRYVRIDRCEGVSRTIWTIRNEVDVATVLPTNAVAWSSFSTVEMG